MDDLLGEFLTETAEALAELDVELVRLERNPNDPALIGSIFRLVHTIKGTCGFLDLPRLETLAHAAENVLGRFRDGELEVTAGAVTLILQTLDQIKAILAALEKTEKEPAGDDAALIRQLDAFAESGTAAPSAAEPPPQSFCGHPDGAAGFGELLEILQGRACNDPGLSPLFAEMTVEAQNAILRDLLVGGSEGADPAAVQARFRAHGLTAAQLDALLGHLEAVLREARPAERMIDAVLAFAESCRPAMSEAPADPRPADARKPRPTDAPDAEEAGARELSAAAQSIRVGVSVLEGLMTMVSELVLVRNQLLQMVRAQEDSEFAGPLQRLNHITSELQEGVMKTRMQPIGNAWQKLPRIVRDLSQDLGKRVELEMVGAETELDRQVLELIKDPLTHMVRNAVDHGLERPAERVAAGKPETGRIRLHAFHEGGHIILRIADDGRGLSTDRIREKIVRNGLASAAEVETMPDAAVQQFIFKPGFSTAEQVTNVSGRGVGMDVVRSNIERIGGTIEMSSTLGRGTDFIVKIPLTLAIVSALIVECAGQRFAIPQIGVRELVRASRSSEHRIETIDRTPVLRLRNRLLPLVSLRELLELGPAEQGEADAFIVVSQVGAYSFGIMVDRVFDAEEIVVKPVAPMLRDNPVFSGNTILGDGSIVMILDPNGIATRSGEMTAGEGSGAEAAVASAAAAEDRVPLLLFRAGGAAPKAVPLALVARLEEIDGAAIENASGRLVVQYRGGLMPLVKIDPAQTLAATGRQPVVVFTDRDRAMGLIVDEILDVVEDRLDFRLAAESGRGIMGTAVVAGKATEVVDTGFFLTQAFPDWFGSDPATASAGAVRRRVLLVDDSAFFRNLLAPLLGTAGYEVTAAEDGRQAIALCEAGQEFEVIVSDIDMPGMDGFSFAEAVRRSERWRDVPLIALSARTSAADMSRGRAAGYTDYVPKSDREGLLETLAQTLSTMRGAA